MQHNLCFSYDGTTVSASQPTNYLHYKIYHLATYLGQPMTVGSWSNSSYLLGKYSRTRLNHAKTEIMNLKNGQWQSGPDYPFSSMYDYHTMIKSWVQISA